MTSYLKNYFSKFNENERSLQTIAYLASLDYLSQNSPEISSSIVKELIDQRSHLKMIASENFSSLAVQLAMGNLLTDKYAEGYAHHRFYAGCENVDTVEELAQKELCQLFGCDYASVQPHSGADANLMAFWAILCHKIQNKEIENLGKKTLEELSADEYEKIRLLLTSQKMLGLSLNSGGHLTHGFKHNISSKMMQAHSYEVNFNNGLIDYEIIQNRANEVKPLILLAGFSSYPGSINFAKMREIADSVGAVLMVDMAHFAGLVAGKVFTGEYDPIPYADIVTSTTHKTLRGPRGGILLCTKEYAEIVNKGCPLVMGGPLPHVMAAKAIAFKEANTPEFSQYAHQIVKNSKALAAELMNQGIKILTNGTENHMIIINLTDLPINGRQGEKALREAQITANRNAIPNDKNGAWYTSGIRIGTPALTTLGMKEAEMKEVGQIIALILKNAKPSLVEKTGEKSKANFEIDQNLLKQCKDRIDSLLKNFPLYPEIMI